MRGDGGVVGVAVTEGNASRRPGDPSTDDHVADLDEGGDETFGRVAQRATPTARFGCVSETERRKRTTWLLYQPIFLRKFSTSPLGGG